MGIKNLAFCDAEVSYSAFGTSLKRNLDADMHVLRWKKLDLVGSTYSNSADPPLEDSLEAADPVADGSNLFSPSVLSRTAYQLIVKEVLSVDPDIILIEKQRWRSGGGSAVQQWTVRVNTLEAMFWAILEALKQSWRCRDHKEKSAREHGYHVHAVDPKRVGQYWLGQHARALQERDEGALALDVAALSKGADESEDAEEEEGNGTATKKPSRSKAEKSAKIAILRSWLTDATMSTTPSTPCSMPHITLSIDPSADSTRQALLPKHKATRRKKSSKTAAKDAELIDGMPATEIKKLDDITDCFLQAAAWVAWESNRLQLMAVSGDNKSTIPLPVDEDRILKMIRECGET